MSPRAYDRRSTWKPAPRPEWVARLNEEGEHLNIASIVPLDEDSLLAEARKNTGLDDFGSDRWLEHFRVLIRAIENEAKLNLCGRILTRSDLLIYLEARLMITDCYKQHPEIEDEVITEPVFIVGSGRSGTTIFHEALSQDEQFRVVKRWEAMFPCPPPIEATYLTDPRIEKAHKLITLPERIAPEWKTMHAQAGDLPVECIEFLYLTFLSEVYYCAFQIPSYVDYFRKQDIRETFHWHKRILKLLQWKYKKPHWLLKGPTHMPVLPKLLETYPDAKLIFMHRDQVTTADSVVSVQGTIYWWRTDDPWSGNMLDEVMMIEGRVKLWDRIIGWLEDGTIPKGQAAHVVYQDFSADPMPAIRGAYRQLGLPMSEAAAKRIEAYLANKPKGVFGKHEYKTGGEAAEAAALERKALHRYYEYFGVPKEG
ncbi:sulfotransferase [Myxococcota bacterium]|nr:sulfotransferase [Myxococcota bacterium]